MIGRSTLGILTSSGWHLTANRSRRALTYLPAEPVPIVGAARWCRASDSRRLGGCRAPPTLPSGALQWTKSDPPRALSGRPIAPRGGSRGSSRDGRRRFRDWCLRRLRPHPRPPRAPRQLPARASAAAAPLPGGFRPHPRLLPPPSREFAAPLPGGCRPPPGRLPPPQRLLPPSPAVVSQRHGGCLSAGSGGHFTRSRAEPRQPAAARAPAAPFPGGCRSPPRRLRPLAPADAALLPGGWRPALWRLLLGTRQLPPHPWPLCVRWLRPAAVGPHSGRGRPLFPPLAVVVVAPAISAAAAGAVRLSTGGRTPPRGCPTPALWQSRSLPFFRLAALPGFSLSLAP